MIQVGEVFLHSLEKWEASLRLVQILLSRRHVQVALRIGRVASVLCAPLLARVSACLSPTKPLSAGINLMSTWLFSPSLLSASTASRAVLDFILVLSRARIAAWLSQFMTTFLFSFQRIYAALPTAKTSA